MSKVQCPKREVIDQRGRGVNALFHTLFNVWKTLILNFYLNFLLSSCKIAPKLKVIGFYTSISDYIPKVPRNECVNYLFNEIRHHSMEPLYSTYFSSVPNKFLEFPFKGVGGSNKNGPRFPFISNIELCAWSLKCHDNEI